MPAEAGFSAATYSIAPAMAGTRRGVKNEVPFSGGFIQFINDAHGFVLSGQPSGMFKHAVELYQTTDGGLTWTLQYTNNPLVPGAGTSLPFGGNKTGMRFRDTLRGWVSGKSPLTGSPYLYKTVDGGLNWTQQTLPLPVRLRQRTDDRPRSRSSSMPTMASCRSG